MRSFLRIIFGVLIAGSFTGTLALGQDVAKNPVSSGVVSEIKPGDPDKKSSSTATAKPTSDSTERMGALEETLRQQSAEIEQMRKMMEEQHRTIQLLAGKLASAVPSSPANGSTKSEGGAVAEANATAGTTKTQASPIEERLKKVEDKVLKFGPFRFSGDFRLRADGILRSASKAPSPALAHAQNVRARYRLRFNFDTDLYPNLSFHGQLSTGPVNNSLTADQDFSATTVRHPFFISEAWIDYHPNKSIQIQGGRVLEAFADNSRFLFDDDIRFNGFNEKYTWFLKQKPLGFSGIEFRAGQYILTNPNVAIVTPGSPLDHAGQIVGTTARSANLFHQGVLFNQEYNKKWNSQFGGDVQLYRNPNQIALASTAEGLTLLIQPGIGLALSGPLPGTGTATTTAGGAIYSAKSFKIARLTYRLSYAGFESGEHKFPVTFNLQFARNAGTGLSERDAWLAAVQVGKITKRGDTSFLYVYSTKGANALISQVTDDDLGTGTGVNITTNHFRFEYGLAKKVTFQSLLFIQNQRRNSAPNFFVPLGAFAPRQYRFQEQLVFSF